MIPTPDGPRREVWATAHTVEGAPRELDVRVEGAYLSIGGGADVPREEAVRPRRRGRVAAPRPAAAGVTWG